MIPALCWIPRGAARRKPVKYELAPEELQRVQDIAKEEAEIERDVLNGDNDGAESDNGEVVMDDVDISDLPPELDMENYDDSEEEMDGDDAKLAIMETGDKALAVDVDSDDEDDEDDEIKASDSLLLVAITEDEYSHLEVQLLDDNGNMYVHHDITLPEFPLCLAWMDIPPFQQEGGQTTIGNYVAVGTFDPAIEIWNLDVLDPLEPSAVLGGLNQDDAKKKKKKKKGKKSQPSFKTGSHEDAVMCLSWNKLYRQALSSGSADKTVKVWDVTTQQCSYTFTHHTDKVQAVQFHPEEAWLLASGSFDRVVSLLDCRSCSLVTNYKVTSDIEAMAWDPFTPFHLYTSLEDGQVSCIDIRQAGSPLFSFQGHEKTVSSLSFSTTVPGLLATASVDKSVRVWDLQNVSESKTPELVAYKSLSVGKLFTVQYYPNNPFMLAAAGDKGTVAVWESDETLAIAERFQSRIDSTREPNYLGLKQDS